MAKYIDAEKIRDEIERRKKENMYYELPMTIGRYYEDRDLLSFLDTLEGLDVGLIKRSWYMEGYHDCEFGYEPRWIIKTGKGGPRFAENPKYGQHIEKQDYSGLNDFERAIYRGFLCAGVVNVPVNIIKETAQDCLAHLPVEWSEDFDKEVENVHKRYPEVSFAKLTRIAYHFSKWANRRNDMGWREQSEKRK